ncbi:triose-phosphate isomerase [Leucobacter weissii]|uniref:Triosephosphate isomerase n=1 Tax=Leucobacter weissii TaxID=1983706 RepID=A0A939SCM8_9MICO|nr:triose-phosphate isomerase [Leucobacter weissii]MBO1902605.1 triose-phosphate isomerase [Leucobacter weissii]
MSFGKKSKKTASAPAVPEQAEQSAQSAQPEVPAPVVVERVPLIAGNWKMNLDHLQAIALVQKLSWSLKDVKHDYGTVEVAVFPPFTDLRSVQTLLAADRLALRLGAQDVSPNAPGAFTGDVAASFLSKLGADYVIVGHSERRQGHGEDDATVAAKARAAAAAGIAPLICVGETAEDRAASGAAAVPLAQLDVALSSLEAGAEFVVAYEPVWAIGSGEPASPEQAQEVIGELRARVRQSHGDDAAARTRLLYGGSVTSQNVAAFLRQPDIDGALVGGASLDADEFSRIVQFKKHVIAG